jgi:hypothetical protein
LGQAVALAGNELPSPPFLNFTLVRSFGNRFCPSRRRHVFLCAVYVLARHGNGSLVGHSIMRATKVDAEAREECFDEKTTE